MELVTISRAANRTVEEDTAIGAIALVVIVVSSFVGIGIFIGWLIWA